MGPAIRRRRTWTAFAFLAPSLLGMIIFFVFPLIMTVVYSFTAFDLSNAPRWNNFANWKFLFGGDPLIGQAALNTLWFVAILVPVRIAGAMLVAWALTRARRSSGALRTLYYLPALVPPVASTIAFVFLLNPATGPVNRLLEAVGIQGPGWFTDPSWSKPALVMLGLWVLGDIMVIFLAALLDVPTEQYEAAELDGANGLQRFRHITIPNMAPVLLFALITGVIAALQYFTEPAVASSTAMGKSSVGAGTSTTLGWPDGSTLTYGQLLYSKAFGANLFGYASAMAVVLLVVAGAVTFVLLRRFSSFSPEVAS
ncbi:carbohydrate ABC transporter permease [Cellulomonas sp. PhB150]|uniref:carbohydrate ABC transporter permease n=1 Tax=Cellulomonas sp. PhB150 TaxID=2485188 RepID=UPI000F4A0D02|nr:sugar ABC transporter permease [Cellulomonas sp. PhB150]ROS25975.1 carbohydrate ABC transporter membrane protein 1 (CUT1 family) [Cellulomonas sp. PhB150]